MTNVLNERQAPAMANMKPASGRTTLCNQPDPRANRQRRTSTSTENKDDTLKTAARIAGVSSFEMLFDFVISMQARPMRALRKASDTTPNTLSTSGDRMTIRSCDAIMVVIFVLCN